MGEGTVEHNDLTDPYRIGWRSRYKPWRIRRPWQSESETERFARRAFTAQGAQRKMTQDIIHRERTGKPSLWQRWRKLRARRFDRASK